MAEYIEREAFVEQKRKQYCEECYRRKGMKNGKYKTLYEIGEAPCRACEIDDMLNDVEDFPAADVRPVVHGKWLDRSSGWTFNSECNKCGFIVHEQFIKTYKYCPNCGADMRGEKDV